jgi:hypothetical protein
MSDKPKGVENLARREKISVPIKEVWVYPIDKNFRVLLKQVNYHRQRRWLENEYLEGTLLSVC